MNRKLLRKIALLLVTVLLIFAVVGCGKKEEKNSSENDVKQEGLVVQRTISPTIDEPTQTAQVQTSETEETETEPPVETVDPSAQQTSSAEIPAGTVSIAYVNANDVNVRQKPASDAEILGKYKQNTIVYVTKKDAGNDWSEISYNGNTAYIASYLLNTITDSASLTYECTATVNADDINIRADSTTDSDAIAQAAKGTKVNVIKKDAGHEWSMIHYENYAAFVATRLLSFE